MGVVQEDPSRGGQSGKVQRALHSSPYKMGCRSIRRLHNTGIRCEFVSVICLSSEENAEHAHQVFVATLESDLGMRPPWCLAPARKTW